MNQYLAIIAAIAAPLMVFPGQAQERLNLEGTVIIGNQELPKILYIVPWKAANQTEISTPVQSSIIDEPLRPIDPAAFRRKINYHNAISTGLKKSP
ncbi:MAG: hypothetical protein ACI9LO_000226 [Planctomycetota bacterium]|jgi:hypothetical protein